MPKTKVSEFDATASNNTDVNSVNIAEGCAPSGINDAIREVMAAIKRFQTGADGDSVTVGGNLVVSGSLTATLTGNVTGNVTGDVTGDVSGSAGSLATTNWTVSETGGVLYFKYGGTNKASLDSSGNLVVIGNVTAYGTI